MRWLAIVGVRKELESIAPKNTGRRLFLFYLLNDQMRHLYRHFEDIDLHAVEFAMPFFDMDFLSLVVASPVGMFLRHRLYNRWLSCFKTPAASVPWQAYPGHEAGHLPLPAGIRSQWSNDWYRGAATRLLADRVATRILVERDARVSTYISRRVICILKLLNRVGIERYNYELWRARKVYEYIKGESIGG
jgi:hypothetical protein